MLIVTHGWPGLVRLRGGAATSVVEQLKIVAPLTDPTAHGGSASDAFHLVIPSMPGYGYSGKPTTTGWGPERIARAYYRYNASGVLLGSQKVRAIGTRRGWR
jgi:pimeloyl-ACP methyl ester carboxylesterase